MQMTNAETVRRSILRYLSKSKRGVNIPRCVAREWAEMLTPEVEE